MEKKKFSAIQKKLIDWFVANQRDLPWRKRYEPYEVWISEIMLQQTQVKTVLPYYARWMQRFPDIASVAAASEEELLKLWEGLGYYSRVRNIQKVAKILVREYAGVLPNDRAALLRLPGIGRYTAGAIRSLAFNEECPVVDGNVERVFARLFDLRRPVKEKETRAFIWKAAAELIPKGEARLFNQAVMELGALVCTPKAPACPRCPVRSECTSFQRGVVDQRPVPGAKRSIASIEAAIGILSHEGKLFIQKRPPSGLMAHLWEFPGGKIEAGETPEEALVREFREELDLEVCCLHPIARIRHSYTHFKVTLHAFRCALRNGRPNPVLRSAVEGRWVTPEELSQYAFPAANRKLIGLLQEAEARVVLVSQEPCD